MKPSVPTTQDVEVDLTVNQWKWRAIIVLVPLALLMTPFILLRITFGPNGIVIDNASGAPLHNIRLIARDTIEDDDVVLDELITELGVGQTITFDHRCNDLSLTLEFEWNGQVHHHTDDYVDLWWDEKWRITIRPDAQIDSNYDRTEFPQHSDDNE